MSSTVLLIDLLGAAALLICGLRMLKGGVTKAFGAQLRLLLATSTSNRLMAFAVGLLVTLALQSSTATAIMTSSFVAQGLVTLAMAQAMMLGANVGTSLVTQLLALDVHWLAGIAILAGAIVSIRAKSTRSSGAGEALLGLGLMLLSLKLMGEATDPMRGSAPLAALLGMLGNAPVIAVAAAALLAAASASSLAVVLLVMSLAGAGSIEPGLCLLFVAGANLGGSIPPLFAVAAEGVAAKQLAMANLLVRLLGTVVLIAAVSIAPDAVGAFSGSPELVINAHVLFNIVLAIVFLPFLAPINFLVSKLLPMAETPEDGPLHLDDAALAEPTAALAGATRETLRMGDLIEDMLEASLGSLRGGNEELCRVVAVLDDQVDTLETAIKLYLSRLRSGVLDAGQTQRADEIVSYAINLEHVGDIVDKSLARLAAKKINKRLPFSQEGFGELRELYRQTLENLRLSQTVFMTRDHHLARQLIEAKTTVRRLERNSIENHLGRYRKGRVESVQTSSLHLDIIRDLKRINAYLASVAYPILDEMGELRDSRLLGS